MYTHNQGVCVGAESVKKKLVIQPNRTELVDRGSKEKEEKRHDRYPLRSQAGASVTCYCIQWEGCIHACACVISENKNWSFTARSVRCSPHAKRWLFSTFYLVVLAVLLLPKEKYPVPRNIKTQAFPRTSQAERTLILCLMEFNKILPAPRNAMINQLISTLVLFICFNHKH